MAELNPRPLKLKKKFGSLPGSPPSGPSEVRCSGTLAGASVAVSDPQHIWALVRLGAYGKGVFSRSLPSHQLISPCSAVKDVCRKRKASPVKEGEGKKQARICLQLIETQKDTQAGMLYTEDSGAAEISSEYQGFVQRLTVSRDTPYHMEEYLQLGAEEAYHLTAVVKALSVADDTGMVLTADQLWDHFAHLDHSFPARYAAYAHYRTGNWVPKSGLKFGVDFLLYKESPLAYHSSFAVVVKEELQHEEDQCGSRLTWKEVIAQNRVSESAGKDLLVCHVTKPDGKDLSQVAIEDVIVERWVPEQDREV